MAAGTTVDTHDISIPHTVLATHPIVESLETSQTQRDSRAQKGFCASRNELDDGVIPIHVMCSNFSLHESDRFLYDLSII